MPATRASFDAKVDRSGEHHVWLGTRTAAGNGQLRVDGKLRTAAQVAWELEHGEIPPGHRVRGCPDEPSCVAVEHLTLQRVATGTKTKARAPRGAGSIARLGTNKWKVTIDAGRDGLGRRRRLVRTVHGSKAQASRAMATLLVGLAEGEIRPTTPGGSGTVNELMAWYFEFARDVRGLEHSTVVGYQDVYEKWLAGEIGDRSADRLSPAGLDNAFARMRRAGLSRSRMNNALSALSGRCSASPIGASCGLCRTAGRVGWCARRHGPEGRKGERTVTPRPLRDRPDTSQPGAGHTPLP